MAEKKLLNLLLKGKVAEGSFKLHHRCHDPAITHFCFADDLMAFFHGDRDSALALSQVLLMFKACTRLSVNYHKSNLYSSGVSHEDLQDLKSILGFNLGYLPVRYLGLPLISTRLSYVNCLPLIERVRKRIQSWKNRYLSFAGRVTLIKSVLNSMHIFWTACYSLPKRVIKELNSIMRNFLWSATDTSNKKPMVKWRTICHLYDEGGLGIRSIQTTSLAAMIRHVWNIVKGKENLWVKWVTKNLIKDRDFWLMAVPQDASWCWRNILACRQEASSLIRHAIGNGENTSLWKVPWHPMGVLMPHFPQQLVYDSLLHKNATVSALIRDGCWFARDHARTAIDEIFRGLALVDIDTDYSDEIVWIGGMGGEFSSKSAYHALRHKQRPISWTRLIWFKGRIPRHSFIGWLALSKSLKTQDRLRSWNQIASSVCSLCRVEPENEEHLFFSCGYSRFVWAYMLRTMGYDHQPLDWEAELSWCLVHFAGSVPCSNIKKLTFVATIYHLWCERNRRLFRQERLSTKDLIMKIVSDVRLRVSVLELKVEDSPQHRAFFDRWNVDVSYFKKQNTWHAWSKPDPGWVVLNSDGSLTETRDPDGTVTGLHGGYGAIIRDHRGDVITAGAGSAVGRSVLLHELQGAEMGLTLAKQHNLRNVIMCMDSMNAYKCLTTSIAPPWEARATVRRMKAALRFFDQFKIIHVFREVNQAADKLVSLRPSAEFLEILPSSFDEDLKKIVFDDKRGRKYMRL